MIANCYSLVTFSNISQCKSRQQPSRKSKQVHNYSQSKQKLPFSLQDIDQVQNSIAEIHKERSYETQACRCNCHMQQACSITLKKVKHYSMHN